MFQYGVVIPFVLRILIRMRRTRTTLLKDLEIQDEFNLLQNLHLYTQKSVCATSTRPFGEFGGKTPLQLSSRTHFSKIEDKKSYCEKISLKTYQLEFSGL